MPFQIIERREQQAISQVKREVAKINFDSEQAPFQISELRKLAQKVASKTETTATELFAQYIRLARKRQESSLPRTQEKVAEAGHPKKYYSR